MMNTVPRKEGNVMAVKLPEIVCVNCHLYTRADQLLCLNDGPPYGPHRRDVKISIHDEPHQEPTAQDLEAYSLWLSRNGATPLFN